MKASIYAIKREKEKGSTGCVSCYSFWRNWVQPYYWFTGTSSSQSFSLQSKV